MEDIVDEGIFQRSSTN